MTESSRHEDMSSKRVELDDGQIEVFFDGSVTSNSDSIILDTAVERTVVQDTPYGIYEYDELVLSSGDVLGPADLSFEQKIIEFNDSLEPATVVSSGALLRTVDYRQESKFLEIVKNDTTISQRRLIRGSLLESEQNRIPGVLARQRDLFDEDDTLELWVRLEAANNPDKALVGKIIVARLAYLATHRAQVGMIPIVYDAVDDTLSEVPEQLTIHESWLYRENM